MKKVFKDYFEVYVGSRGVIEGVSIKSFENIEEYLEFKSNENKDWEYEFDSEEEKKEVLEMWGWGKDVNDDYYLGLGDEECKVYIDMKSKKFLDWKEKNGISVEYGLNDIRSELIKELL